MFLDQPPILARVFKATPAVTSPATRLPLLKIVVAGHDIVPTLRCARSWGYLDGPWS